MVPFEEVRQHAEAVDNYVISYDKIGDDMRVLLPEGYGRVKRAEHVQNAHLVNQDVERGEGVRVNIL